MGIELIYCANGNKRFAEIAIKAGFTYGAQLPGTVYFPPEFVDQNWKKPNLEKYIEAIKKHRPRLATVLDWERQDQLSEVLSWAESIAPYIETIIIIPKTLGGVGLVPSRIGNRPIRLGYSIPTKHGGTAVPYSDFGNRPVHLLGGSPHKQFRLKHFMNVVSADGNMIQKMANQFCAFFDPQKKTTRGIWPTLKDADGQKWGDESDKADAPCEALRRSCKNIMKMWTE